MTNRPEVHGLTLKNFSIPGGSVRTHSNIPWFKITQLIIFTVLFSIFTLEGMANRCFTNELLFMSYYVH